MPIKLHVLYGKLQLVSWARLTLRRLRGKSNTRLTFRRPCNTFPWRRQKFSLARETIGCSEKQSNFLPLGEMQEDAEAQESQSPQEKVNLVGCGYEIIAVGITLITDH